MSRQEKRERQAKAEAAFKDLTKELLQVKRGGEDPKRLQEIISDHLSRTENLYPLIRKKLAGSAADAKHLRSLLNLCGETAKLINTRAKPFNLKRIILAHKREHGKNLCQFVTGVIEDCFRIPPTFEFFYGAIKQEGLEIKQRKKRVKIQIDEVRTISATERNITTDCEQDSTPKEVEQICAKIKRMSDARNNAGIDFLTAVVDPNSFTQTVENIFHTSFLVKEGRVGVRKNQNNKPVITYESQSDSAQERNKPRKQSILSFSMDTYNNWRKQQTGGG